MNELYGVNTTTVTLESTNAMQSLTERAKSAKTLICLLQSLIGEKVTIELRNDYELKGTIISCDSNMNIELNDAVMSELDCDRDISRNVNTFHYFFVKGTRIRFVHIPEHIDVIESIEKRLKSTQRRLPKQTLNKSIDSSASIASIAAIASTSQSIND